MLLAAETSLLTPVDHQPPKIRAATSVSEGEIRERSIVANSQAEIPCLGTTHIGHASACAP